jgi:ABC-type nitrate/sulfonate/bicarbonate transport system substrate-binding protein
LLGLAWLLATCAAPGPSTAPAAETAPASAVSAHSATPPPTATLRAGIITNSAYTFYIAADRGYFQEQGIDLRQEVFSGGNDMTASLATGQLDVAQTAVQVSLLNALLRDVPVRAIFDTNHFGVGQQGYGVVARKDLWDSGVVRQLTDLVGRKVAIGGAAGGPGIDVERGLQAHGSPRTTA